MKYLNAKYNLFESEINDIIKKCKEYNINNYEIGDDGLLTVYENVSFYKMPLKEIPIKFKEVYGDFIISYNDISSLLGAPLIVGGSFYSTRTKIKNLKYAPIEVEHCFFCVENECLNNIKQFPKHVGMHVSFRECNKLNSLYGCLKFINGGICLNGCNSLESLKYGPHKVLDAYLCVGCRLKSLYGAPEYVGVDFDCSKNKLTTLKYSPTYIGGNFYFYYNNISSFDYFPDYVGGEINCGRNPIHNVWTLFKDKDYINYFNQLKIISVDGKKINIKRLNVFLNSIGKKSVENVDGYENI